ncbi:phosphotransferase [Pelagibacteraceae bacterium]|nr:phosphotransferase [Pelagibacteraceae bacterium]
MTTLINFNKKKEVGIAYLHNKKIIRKFFLNQKKNKLMENESNGHQWYSFRKKKNFNNYKFSITTKKNYIDFPIIIGNKKNFWDYLEINYEESLSVISHYKKIWPNQKVVPCHGDLTFSNIIFDKNQDPIIIDWENFLIKKMNWGYDLSYFLISTVSLPSIFHNDKKIKVNELLLLEKLWKKAFTFKKYKYLSNPVNFIKSAFGKTFILRDFSDYFPNLLSKYKIKQINETLKINFK